MSGGGGQTSTQSNAPPAEYLAAYKQVLDRANKVADAPYQDYPGQLQAGFSPQQQQGFDIIGSAPGIQAPYLNAAAQNFTNATEPLRPLMQPYVDAATINYTNAGNTSLQGALAPYQNAAASGFGAGSQALTPQQYSGEAVQNYYNPFQQNVVDATQKQFALLNATQQNQLRGNAASQGALGGDRFGVAQAQMAGQQMANEAPVLAGLESQGFQQAQGEFNNQQQTNLTAQQQSRALQMQGAQGLAGLGGQSLTAAQQQAALRAQVAQGFAGLGQAELGAGQSQGWLNAQAGSGLAGLGTQALQGALSSGNALLGAGGLQQQQAQQGLNIPYEQWQASRSYPFQTTGWLSNIAQGLGGASGSTGSSTSPGPSAGSQIAGLGSLATAGYGLAKDAGWLGGSSGAGMAAGSDLAALSSQATANISAGAAGLRRGGLVRGFGVGGGIPNVSVNGVNVGEAPGSQSIMDGGSGVPDLGASIVPGGFGMGSNPARPGSTPFLKRDYGSTTTRSGNGDSTIGSILKTAGTIAATIYGGPAGGAAANTLGSQVHFGRGGHVPIAPRGFAAGGPAITVTTIPNARGVGVPMMNVDPTVMGHSVPSSDPTSPLNAYLAQTAAGAYHPPPFVEPPPAAPAPKPDPTPPPPSFDPWMDVHNPQMNGGGQEGGMARGGSARGFDDGGDVGSDDPSVSPYDFGRVTNLPAGRHLSNVVGFGQRPSVPDRPTAGDAPGWADTPVMQMIPDFLRNAWAKSRAQNEAFNRQTGRDADPDPDLYGDVPGARGPDETPPSPRMAPPHSENASGTGGNDPTATESETHGGNWHPGVTASDDSPVTTPAGPAGTTTAGGFGTHGPAGPSVPAPTSDSSASGGFGASSTPTAPSASGFGARRSYADELGETRALKEDKANPWLSLAVAGAAMLAGKSHFAGENIGAGVLAGLNHYSSTDRAAKELAAKVMENKTRLAETHAYRDATTGIKQQNANTAAFRAQSYAAIQQFKQQNPSLTAAGLKSKMIEYWQNQGMSAGEAFDHVQGLDVRQGALDETRRHHGVTEGQSGDRIEIAQQRLMNSDTFQQQQLALRQAGLDQNTTANIMNNATRAVVGDVTGRMTLEEAVKQQRAQRGSQPAPAAAAQPTTAPKLAPPPPDVLTKARAAIAAGKDGGAVMERLRQLGYDASGLTAP